MLAIQFLILIAFLVTLINLTNGQTCGTASTIPSQTTALCFSIPKGAQDDNACVASSSCDALARFQPSFLSPNTTQVRLESVVPFSNATVPPPIWLRLQIYLNDTRRFRYISLECAAANSTGEALIDAQGVTVVAASPIMTALKLECDYSLTAMLSPAQRVAGSFDPRNKHYLRMEYGYFTNDSSQLNNVEVVVDTRISLDPLYQFEAGIGTTVHVVPGPTTTTIASPDNKNTGSNSKSQASIWPAAIVLIIIMAIVIYIIGYLLANRDSSIGKSAQSGKETSKVSHLNQPPALSAMIPVSNQLVPPPSYLTATPLPASVPAKKRSLPSPANPLPETLDDLGDPRSVQSVI